jgi:hypothetical protein
MKRTFIRYVVAVLVGLVGSLIHWAAKTGDHTPAKANTACTEILPAPAVVRNSPDPREIMELPEKERVLISGEGALDSASYFNCWVTNRSSWTVTELRFRIAAGQPEGSTRWERNYREYLTLPPRHARRISFKVTDGKDAETRWEISGARGVPSD